MICDKGRAISGTTYLIIDIEMLSLPEEDFLIFYQCSPVQPLHFQSSSCLKLCHRENTAAMIDFSYES